MLGCVRQPSNEDVIWVKSSKSAQHHQPHSEMRSRREPMQSYSSDYHTMRTTNSLFPLLTLNLFGIISITSTTSRVCITKMKRLSYFTRERDVTTAAKKENVEIETTLTRELMMNLRYLNFHQSPLIFILWAASSRHNMKISLSIKNGNRVNEIGSK